MESLTDEIEVDATLTVAVTPVVTNHANQAKEQPDATSTSQVESSGEDSSTSNKSGGPPGSGLHKGVL